MKKEKKQIRINDTLLELYIGILLFAAVCQITIIWLVADKIKYSTGLWCGALLAIGSAWHMYRTLNEALTPESGSAESAVRKGSIQRYLAIVVILAAVMITNITNPLSMFLGLMGLKVAAYVQPFTHKLLYCLKKEKKT